VTSPRSEPAAVGGRWTLVIGVVASCLALVAGFVILRNSAGSEIEPFGWILVGIGALTLIANLAIWKQRQ
jgi:hypothetical protein